jgi:hypothetical protein
VEWRIPEGAAGLKKEASTGDSGGSAVDRVRQRQAIIAFDIPTELGINIEEIAKKVRAKVLVIISSQDHLVNPKSAERFAVAAGAPVITLDSTCGHQSLTCISVGPIVARFLADPSSVHSETLHDSANY